MIEQKTMKAVVFHGVGDARLEDVQIPQIKDPDDIIVRVTLSTICGSDIHIVGGHAPGVRDGVIIGHEFVGEIVEMGPGVRTLELGDRVVIDCLSHCGICYQCRQGNYAHCEVGACFGYTKDDGCQAEYVRVPYANACAYKIPADVSDEDVLFVGDILSTGYHGAEQAMIKPGDTVVVFGAGPVGMCAMLSARLYSPLRIIAVDPISGRLNTCLEQGLTDIGLNPAEVNVPQKVLEITKGRGADVSIEASGTGLAFDACIESTKPYGNLSMIGMNPEPHTLNMVLISLKNINIATGWLRTINIERLINLIQAGKIDTKFLMTHRAPLNDILTGYDIFGNKKDGCLKWIVTPYEK